jgi:uncharacterized protein (TIGR03435 family)
MTERNDHELLAEFARGGSEEAFATLTARHVNLVYSAALRFTGNPHHAQEIAQAVFIILARKAKSISRKTILSGWLYQTARLTAANFVKGEIRRQQREQEAYMQSTLTETNAAAWQQLAPLLDEAMGRLGETDRNAVVLRFFENKTAQEVGSALQLTEAAAHKRTARALEKLRGFFTKRGVALSATVIAGAVSAGSVQAAPAGLAATISTVALTKGAAAGGSTLALVKGVLKLMAWTKAQTVVAVSVGVFLAAGTTTIVVKEVAPRFSGDTDKYFLEMGRTWNDLKTLPPYFIVRPTHFEKLVLNGTTAIGSKDRAIGRAMDFKSMLGYAYDFHNQPRTIFPENLPAGRFDFLVSVPDALGKFQAEIKKQFGYTAQKDVRTTDVLVMKVRTSNAPGLKPSAGTRSNQSSQRSSGQFGDWPNMRLPGLTGQFEVLFEQPVVDQTGLNGTYDIKLDWQYGTGDAAKAALRQAVFDQLGLELVSTNMPIEMLVVEKVK